MACRRWEAGCQEKRCGRIRRLDIALVIFPTSGETGRRAPTGWAATTGDLAAEWPVRRRRWHRICSEGVNGAERKASKTSRHSPSRLRTEQSDVQTPRRKRCGYSAIGLEDVAASSSAEYLRGTFNCLPKVSSSTSIIKGAHRRGCERTRRSSCVGGNPKSAGCSSSKNGGESGNGGDSGLAKFGNEGTASRI